MYRPRQLNDRLTLYADSQCWIEGEALRQLERAAGLPGMVRAVGLPDLHPGKGGPVGAAFLSDGLFYPYLVGADVGCGMALFSTDLTMAKAKPERWSKRLHGLEESWDGDREAWLGERQALGAGFASSIGTIGLGNHFAELLTMQKVHDAEACRMLDIEAGGLLLLVHSGSRGAGETLLRDHADRFRDSPLVAGSCEAEQYLARHALANAYAAANRELIAYRLLEQLGSGYHRILDLAHNGIERTANGHFLHRKGAAPSDHGVVVIPGSRGSCSFLVMPVGGQADNLWSVAHGAGRKWSRSECEGRLRTKFPAASLQRTKLGSHVICEDRQLLYEEAPPAYKEIRTVIDALVSFGLVRVIAVLSPVLTYKVRRH
ncbi:hypothetical protein GPICK_09605 [Geobacter pickeringii]|uniref:3'-phosphate/5'-hydroxy nucleic acid ligase n=1 Tax=Geobacter pickeringii TaxID=345632 RepID=A0A0B5BLF9_9BACT|nr:hypothetical protein GPICK_09605 [Geobacter pickeringii]